MILCVTCDLNQGRDAVGQLLVGRKLLYLYLISLKIAMEIELMSSPQLRSLEIVRQSKTGRIGPCLPLRMMVPDFDGSAGTRLRQLWQIETLAISIHSSDSTFR